MNNKKKDKVLVPFDPKTKKYPYTEYTDQHYLVVKKNRGIVFDENYPYINNCFWFRFQNGLLRFLFYIVVWWFAIIVCGLKVKGRKNLKKHKEEIKKGIVSVSNHVHLYDYLCITFAVRPNRTKVLVWDKNINGENGWMIRHVGGIPIPTENLKGTFKYLKTVNDYLLNGGWLQIYAEGSMWEYYQPIRPFKKGASHIAIKSGKPIIPMAFSYRKAGWIRNKIFKQPAKFTLNIGEPMYPNDNLKGAEKELDFTRRIHREVCRLAGIEEKQNIYDAIYNNTKKIDYY